MGIFIVPDWQNQPWFPLFKNMLVGEPLYFGPDINLLMSPCRTRYHPRAQHLRLIAGIVSGKSL